MPHTSQVSGGPTNSVLLDNMMDVGTARSEEERRIVSWCH